MSLLGMVATELATRGVPFALIGAGAMAVHGVGRSTVDLELLVVQRDCLAPSYWDGLRARGLEVTIHQGDDQDPLAGVVRFSRAAEFPLDLVVGKSPWQTAILTRAVTTDIERVAVPVAGPADLILLKLYAGGSQDAWDIEQLLASGERAALEAEVERRLAELPPECRRLWARLSEGAGDGPANR